MMRRSLAQEQNQKCTDWKINEHTKLKILPTNNEWSRCGKFCVDFRRNESARVEYVCMNFFWCMDNEMALRRSIHHKPDSTHSTLQFSIFCLSLSRSLYSSTARHIQLCVQMCFRLAQTCNILSQPNGTLNEHQHLSRPPCIVSPHTYTQVLLR